MQFFPGMSFAETITNSFQGMPAPKLIFLISPRGIRLRTVAPKSIPGSVRSSMYRARPVTLSQPSLRGTDAPTMCSVVTGCCRPTIDLLRYEKSITLMSELNSPRITDKSTIAKNRLSTEISSVYDSSQLLAEVRRDWVAMVQAILRHCEFGVGIDDDKVCVVACSESSFGSIASGESRRFFGHPAGDVGKSKPTV